MKLITILVSLSFFPSIVTAIECFVNFLQPGQVYLYPDSNKNITYCAYYEFLCETAGSFCTAEQVSAKVFSEIYTISNQDTCTVITSTAYASTYKNACCCTTDRCNGPSSESKYEIVTAQGVAAESNGTRKPGACAYQIRSDSGSSSGTLSYHVNVISTLLIILLFIQT